MMACLSVPWKKIYCIKLVEASAEMDFKKVYPFAESQQVLLRGEMEGESPAEGAAFYPAE